jgi:putative nucleotidyltransferase with HDIG domain
VRSRILGVVLCSTVLAGGVTVLAVTGNVSSLHAVDEFANRNVPALRLVAVADINLQDAATELRLAMSSPTAHDRAHYRQEALDDIERVERSVAQATPLLSPAGATEIARFPRPWRVWRSAIVRQAAQLRAGSAAGLPLLSSTRNLAAFHQADLALYDTLDIETIATAHERDDVQAATRGTLEHVIIGALLALLVGILLTIRLGRSITRPLARLASAAGRLAGGDLTSRSHVVGADEIGLLGMAFDSMGDRLVQLVRELEQAQIDTIRGLVQTLDARDPYTANHSVSVAVYSSDIARELGLGQTVAETLYLAGLVHDIGKAAIDGSILRKPGKLTDEEFDEIKRHPVIGAQIIGAVPSLCSLVQAVRSHHERADGHGYPDRLRGDEIPLHARIVAVADTWNAMTSDRPYRDGMASGVARAELERVAGDSLDGAVVEAFLRVLDRHDATYGRALGAAFEVGHHLPRPVDAGEPPLRRAA